MSAERREDAELPERVERFVVTVGQVWREAQVSCPHRDILLAWIEGSLEAGAAGYLEFHVHEAACPRCQAIVEDLKRRLAPRPERALEGLKERLRSSTIVLLRSLGSDRRVD